MKEEKIRSYEINRGVGQPLQLHGLKAQYAGYFVALMVGLLGMLGFMHVCGVPSLLGVFLTMGLGGWAARRLYKMSDIYGQHGMMKKSARRNLPAALVSPSREVFIELYTDGTESNFWRKDAGAGSVVRRDRE